MRRRCVKAVAKSVASWEELPGVGLRVWEEVLQPARRQAAVRATRRVRVMMLIGVLEVIVGCGSVADGGLVTHRGRGLAGAGAEVKAVGIVDGVFELVNPGFVGLGGVEGIEGGITGVFAGIDLVGDGGEVIAGGGINAGDAGVKGGGCGEGVGGEALNGGRGGRKIGDGVGDASAQSLLKAEVVVGVLGALFGAVVALKL